MLYAVRGRIQHAEDLTHEVFLRVWRTYGAKAEQMKTAELQQLLITAAKHCVIDAWRRDSKLVFWQAYLDTDVPVDPAPECGADPLDTVVDADVMQRFFELASTRLTDGEWRVTFLGCGIGHSDAEIAHELETTVKTVRTLRWSARKKLKACASRDGYEIVFGDTDQQSSSTPGIGEVTV
ncbi:RNA polymerase sigma factor [Nocardia sp. XZ_19_369]|uniref:RNA polymerase sigma factor n=1 Tax=Nocardia sp. XZ_19_369 TaxID=2769487 RepID=UPI00188F257A|nr:RNA polymerase sigma factor [Nocardia sp. XZ_19_369]